MSQTDPGNGAYQCECGQWFSSKFCPNCGKLRTEEGTFQCECGYNGPLTNFCPNCGKLVKKATKEVTEDKAVPETSDNTVITPPEPLAGWTCPECGSENETDIKCSKCGADIEHFPLFILSEYTTANPPRSSCITVYKFDDTKLILENGNTLRFIPASVLEPAYEIIKENKIDKWEEYKGQFSGFMGGRQAVSYWDGTQLAGASTDTMPEAGGAYYELMRLFNDARMQEDKGET